MTTIPHYRKLVNGDIVQETDEVSSDGGVNWRKIDDDAIGELYDIEYWQPVRRVMAD